MSVRLTDPSHVALFDSVTGTAFGLVFDSAEHAEDFLGTLLLDPRAVDEWSLRSLHGLWRKHRVDPATGLLRDRVTA